MNDLVQIIAIATSAALLAAVILLVRRGRLREEYAFAWMVAAAVLVGIAVWRNSLDIAARWLGVYYPPAVLLLGVILAVFVVSLYFSVVISRQRQQIERLVEEIALLDAEVRGSRSGPRTAVSPAEMVEGATAERRQPR